MKPNPNSGAQYDPESLKTIWLAGGCFWGLEAYLSRCLGVAHTLVGYANGRTEYPTYEAVCNQHTGHAETVEVHYDPEVVSLENLLRRFFKVIDPTAFNRQGNDRGEQYRTGIYYTNEGDLQHIEGVMNEVQQEYLAPVLTEIVPLVHFYPAESYHQKYLEKNPNGYCHINLDED